VGDTPQKWEARPFNDGMGTGFNESEIGKRRLCDQALLAEKDEALANFGRIQADVHGPEAFATSPEFDRN